jgi:hypothetical protein
MRQLEPGRQVSGEPRRKRGFADAADSQQREQAAALFHQVLLQDLQLESATLEAGHFGDVVGEPALTSGVQASFVRSRLCEQQVGEPG